ncbi:chemotaxis protein CheW [Schlesneria paludicola]|uniref:chemotaxis protein CheW n=1 Tax=Schlesneria paludicola TaxID=360056 RepID=UPI00029A0926|nr:chemotaxis protein CheW [Schlesneria paludicola]
MADQAESSSTPAVSRAKAKSSMQFVGFRLADQEYAFRIEQIQEILIPDRVTRMPQVPDYIEGVSNLRGTIIPIINLRRLFDLEPKEKDEETRTIVANVGTKTIGCTVDAVTQVIRITPEQIQPAPEIVKSEGTAYIAGFAKLDTRLVVLLEIDELLDPAKMEQVRQIASRGVSFDLKE